MAKQIKNTAIIQSDFFGDTRESAKSLSNVLNSLEADFKNLGKNAKKSIDELDFSKKSDLVEFEKITSDLVEATKELTKVQKEKKKVDQELSKEEKQIAALRDAATESTKKNRIEVAKLRLESAERRKEATKLAKIEKGLTSEYQKQSEELNELRKSQKDLILTGKESSEVFQEQQLRIDSLDEALKSADARVGQFQRSVGNYEKAADAANKATEALSRNFNRLKGGAIALGGIIAGGGLLGKALKSSEEGAEEFGAAASAASAGVDTLLSGLVDAVSEMVKVSSAGGGVVDSFQAFVKVLDETDENVQKVTVAQFKLFKQQLALEKVLLGIGNGFDKAAKGQTEFNKNLADSLFGLKLTNDQLTTLSNKLFDIAGGADITNKRLAEQIALFEKNSAAADQNTRSLTERENLSAIAAKQSEDALRTEEKQLKARLLLAQEQEKVVTEAGIKSLEASRARSEAEVALIDFESRRNQQRIQNAERVNQILQDQAELELDILIDSFDNQKTINERIIADTRFTLEERNKLLDETSTRFEESFEAQIAVVQELEDRQKAVQNLTERGTNLTEKNIQAELESLATKGELIDLNTDLARIINLSATAQVDEITALNVSEIVQTRVLEILRERRTATQDLADATRDLKNEELDLNDVETDIIAQQKALDSILNNRENLDEALDELDKERLDNEIESLAKRIDLRKENNESTIELEQKLNDKLLQLAKKEAKERSDIEKQRAKDQQAVISSTIDAIDVLDQAFATASNNRINEIDREIQALQSREDALRQAAQNGSELAKDNLATNQRLQAEQERIREEQVKKAQRREIILAGIKAYAQNAGQPNAVGKTLTDITTLSAGLLNLLPSFYEGTEDTGTVSNPLDSKGGRVIIAHDNERIMDKENNKKMGGVSNDYAAQIVHDHLNPSHFDHVPIVQVQRFESNTEVLQKFDMLAEKLDQLPKNMPRLVSENFDEKSKVYTTIIKTRNKVEKNHKKIGGAWG